MFPSIFKRRSAYQESRDRVAELTGMRLMAGDMLFFGYLDSVMRHAQGASDDEIRTAIQGHRAKLSDPDPDRAFNYRVQMMSEVPYDWPDAASHDFFIALEKHRQESDEDERIWRHLPSGARASYVRQGELVSNAVLAGFTSPGTASPGTANATARSANGTSRTATPAAATSTPAPWSRIDAGLFTPTGSMTVAARGSHRDPAPERARPHRGRHRLRRPGLRRALRPG